MQAPELNSIPAPARRSRADVQEGYFGSSLDLRAGLGVCEILFSACPPEVVRELMRMRRSWNDEQQPMAA